MNMGQAAKRRAIEKAKANLAFEATRKEMLRKRFDQRMNMFVKEMVKRNRQQASATNFNLKKIEKEAVHRVSVFIAQNVPLPRGVTRTEASALLELQARVHTAAISSKALAEGKRGGVKIDRAIKLTQDLLMNLKQLSGKANEIENYNDMIRYLEEFNTRLMQDKTAGATGIMLGAHLEQALKSISHTIIRERLGKKPTQLMDKTANLIADKLRAHAALALVQREVRNMNN
jgi:dUTPase